MTIKNYWEKAVTLQQYLSDTEERISKLEGSNDEEEKTYLEYYKLGMTRMHRVMKTYHPQDDLLKKLNEKEFKGKILIISEGWCGDASMIVPVINTFFEGKNEVRIIYRDQNLDLMNRYLTNGAMSIPIVLILNENDEVISFWGPRPKAGMEMLKKHKADPENYNADDFHNDLQVYYTKNKGEDIIEELLEKI
ncbi:thioredoxin family protein [Chryseobacterium sp.]|uniref:thioredoxin family protein n=1 Tax=Chryseobacterium sp. TaxID=1871047 RepID=UPI001625190C|nr:thioredoxin family protein [Chryseobacterium sp.]